MRELYQEHLSKVLNTFDKLLYQEHLSNVLNTFDKLMQKYEYEQTIIYSGEAKTIYLDDNKYPYKVYTNFKYFAPILNNPHSFIIYKIGEKPKLVLFQKVDYWDSQPRPIEGEWTEFFEISYYSKLEDIKKILPSNLQKTCFLGEEIKKFEEFGFKSLNDLKVINYIHFSRSFKSEYEISCMRKANKIASIAHIAAQNAFFEGKSELQTHLAYLSAIDYTDSDLPYQNIVAFDEASAILHYVDYKKESYYSKSFLLDAGASYNGYHADVTRTFAKENHNEFKDLIKEVDKSTLNIISKIKVGMNYEELQEQMHKDVAKMIVDFKLMNISYDEIYEKEYTKLFSPAGVGHYIGLQVHDIGNFISDFNGSIIPKSQKHPFLRLRRDIEVGNVFTIEPGIYIIDQLLKEHYGNKKFNWDNINKLKSFGGVRVEDSVVIKENEVENLTRPYFKEIDESSHII